MSFFATRGGRNSGRCAPFLLRDRIKDIQTRRGGIAHQRFKVCVGARWWRRTYGRLTTKAQRHEARKGGLRLCRTSRLLPYCLPMRD